MIGHDGLINGYQSFMGYDPASGDTLIVLTNPVCPAPSLSR
jgi:hypothetical protein